jgi:hypothetical protein
MTFFRDVCNEAPLLFWGIVGYLYLIALIAAPFVFILLFLLLR